MSEHHIQVVPGPANYYSHPGAIARLADYYSEAQLRKAFWVTGRQALAAAQSWLEPWLNLPGAKRSIFGGHCSEAAVATLAQEAGEDRHVVIGVGGGTVLDTAKALAHRLGLPVVTLPTIAATCAAWTPLSVWYNDAGEALNFEIFPQANHLLLLEPQIILQAPSRYLQAGIGDTLAKWYEAVVLATEPAALPLTVRLGLDIAKTLRDVLLEKSESALADQRAQQLTLAFRDVVDAIVAGGGMVGGLGERYTRIAAAHAVHNGLTVLPQTAQFLHGTKVAYGILVQSALLGQDDVTAHLIEAYKRFGLPTTLAQLAIDIQQHDQVDRIIKHTLRPVESIHYLPVTLTPATLRAALEKVEALGQETPSGHH
ncbi:oxidoreductase [Erwinia sp. 9145]|uniref:oxidoreductase n=1 Tax=Erwinia sp. 9145 TaxID=1500895 RepID=UPI000552BAAC|nr:oxidoreductase [Erwinia sp. 9145]